MSKQSIEARISHLIEQSLCRLTRILPAKKTLPEDLGIQLEIPKDMAHGDLTTNAAMRMANFFGLSPMVLSEKIVSLIQEDLKKSNLESSVSEIEVKKPGFMNFFLSEQVLFDNLKIIKEENDCYGASNLGAGQRIQIEFVSANPTGPLTVAHGRQAAVGDALGKILEFSGHKVSREYFLNDEGRQIDALGESILFHYLAINEVNIPFPEDGYRGAYITEIAEEINKKYKDKFVEGYHKHRKFFSDYGVNVIVGGIKKDLADFNVCFDVWFPQSSLTKKRVSDVLDSLRKKGFVYDKDGAVWFNSMKLGDDKDRVVVKSDGSFTYLAPDIAYHLNKYKRGFKRLVDIWGPDHHGYVPRIKAAIKALGYDEKSLSVLLVQLATLYRDGKALSMSTRKGEFITLKEVIKEVGSDVARFFFLMRKLDSHLDFDLELAKRQSRDNPVFYIQYAHARIWSIKDFEYKQAKGSIPHRLDVSLIKEKEEKNLLRLLFQFPSCTSGCARNLEPYILIAYLNNLARAFHDFYTKHRVVSDDTALSGARLYLIDCVRICIGNGLNLLGVSLPKKM
ncbi:MAG: arginine--tRNA ligase [Candidatus Omnitrophica bacterium]|nr:arginine--tRNA ligase [Candidatus Omnitrophota bacterium]